MIDLQLCGGLGDALITMHESSGYTSLESLKPDQRATVVIISHNPYVDEIFRWHPKASQIEVVKSKFFFMEYHDEKKREDAGIPNEPVQPSLPRARSPIRFYPSPEDLRVIDADLPSEPYLVVAPTASGMEIENRNLPDPIVVAVCTATLLRGIPVVFLGRSYQGPHAPKGKPMLPHGPHIVDFTDRLSIPGTAEVLKRARATVCAHSALLLLSWFERKPNFALYPPKYKWHDFDHPSPFGFGKDYPETTRMLFSEFKPSAFSEFLSTNFMRGNAP